MENNQKKSNKVLISIIIALVLVIVGLVVMLVIGKSNDKSKDESGKTTEAVSEETSTEKTEAETTEQDDSKEEAFSDIKITIKESNNWTGENNSYFAQLDITINNDSSDKVSNWMVKVPKSSDTKLDSNWNCTISEKDGFIEVTSVDHNKDLNADSQISDIGIIVVCKDKNAVNEIINSSSLYVNGEEYINNVNSSNDKKEETTEKVEAKEPAIAESGTPFDNHGKLEISGTDIVDKNGKKYQLKGVSTHGISWFPDYINKDAFKTFRDDWGANVIRLAMYTAENGGYCTDGDKDYLKGLIDKGVNDATDLGMYVIIDWHILHDTNPLDNKEEAKKFFDEVSKKYKNYDNVIYEICNEPNGGTSWSDVKKYADEVIPIIRANHKDAIIIVGTPNWSQDVDIAANDPITGYDNIMYAVHFYASTHKDNIRSKVETALDKGLPIFVSEFSICDASGDGIIDYNETEKWFQLINNNNLSYAGWNISNKDETSSIIKSSCSKTSGWTEDELSETGRWLRNTILGK